MTTLSNRRLAGYGKRILKMKKILALMLALCMVFALAACGEPASEPSDAPVSDAPEASEAPRCV